MDFTTLPAIGVSLLIPWFKLEAWNVPTPYAGAVFGAFLAYGVVAAKGRAVGAAVAGVGAIAGYLLLAPMFTNFSGWESIPVQPFGVLVAIGVLLGSRLMEEYARRRDINPAFAADFATHVVGFGFLGGYLLNGVFYNTEVLMEILGDPSLFFKRWLGLSSYGGFIGAIFGAFVWYKRRGMTAWPLVDAAVFGFPLGWLFGRSGCFVVHDHPGRESDFFLAVADYQVKGGPPFPSRHDLGLYEVIWSAFVVAIFLYLYNQKKDRAWGFYPALFLLLYTPIRFCLDFLRIAPEAGGDVRFVGLTPAQFASIGMFLFSLYILKAHVLGREATALPMGMRLSKDTESKRPKGDSRKEATPSKEASESSNAPSSKPAKSKKKRKKKKK